MGIMRWGSNGGYQGKNGANIGKWVRNRYEIGPLPHPTQKPASIKQVNQRTKFALVVSWLRLLKGVIRTGFNTRKPGVSAWSSAIQYNLKYAVISVSSFFEVNYPAAIFCKGELSVAQEATVTSLADAELKFDWNPGFNPGFGADTDKVTLVVYNPAQNFFTLLVGATTRSAGTFNLQLPLSYSGDMVHCYLSFLSADGEISSDSRYIAQVAVV